MARRLLRYGALLGGLASILIVLFWGMLLYTRAQGTAHAEGLDAAVFLLSTVVGFPLSLLTNKILQALNYPEPLVWVAIVVGPILSFALWGLLVGASADALMWLGRRVRRKSFRS